METLGTKLRAARESKKLSLEDVSLKTKIRPHIIKAFEDENFTVLPPVYAKSFVINYAKFLEIPESEIQDELEEIFRAKVPKPVEFNPVIEKPKKEKQKYSFNNNLLKDNKTAIINFLIYTVIILALVLVVYFTFFDSDGVGGIKDFPSSVEEVIEQADTALIKPDNKDLFSFYEEPDSIILQAKALDSAWLKINIDGKISEQSYLFPKIEKRWAAEKFFLITLGNAGAVEFRRNGELLAPLGGLGKVVRNIKITATEVINSSNPWRDSSKPRRKWNRKKKKKIDALKLLQPSSIEKSSTNNINLTPAKINIQHINSEEKLNLKPVRIPDEKKKVSKPPK